MSRELTAQTENSEQKLPEISRRRFLKTAALLGASAVTAPYEAGKIIQDITNSLQTSVPLAEAAFLADLEDEIPPVLQGIEIPKRNEHFRQPQVIVREAFTFYNKWSEQNPKLTKLHWKKPANYLDYPTLAGNIAHRFTTKDDVLGSLNFASSLYFAADDNDKPYSGFIRFGWCAITSYPELIEYDAGSGIVKRAIDESEAIGKNQQNDSIFIANQIREDIESAVDYIKTQGKPVSTSLLLAYFLYRNEGDIASSFWDTTTTLKLLCRNDLEDLKFQPTRKQAHLLSSLFLDEFSPEASFNWLDNHIPLHDEMLNNPKEERFKNYQPINRVGTLYHGWNIISWSTCMPPELAMSLTGSYFGLFNYKAPHGKEKIKSDLRVSASVPEVRQLIAPFEQNK